MAASILKTNCKHINSTDNVSGDTAGWTSLVIQEDSVVGTLNGKDGTGATFDLLGMCNIAGRTLHAGATITAPAGVTIQNYNMASGTAILYLNELNTY